MSDRTSAPLARAALLSWAASLGAITAEALADRCEATPASARARLAAAERDGLLRRSRPLTEEPALFSLTTAGARMCGAGGMDPCRVRASNARHLVVCAAVAAALERCYPGRRVAGERELRRDERECGRRLASAVMSVRDPRERLHRPDLVVWPPAGEPGLPVAVEVELTLKAPRRLEAICRAWARCREVAGVLYLTSGRVHAAVERAIERSGAEDTVVALPLERLPGAAVERAVAAQP